MNVKKLFVPIIVVPKRQFLLSAGLVFMCLLAWTPSAKAQQRALHAALDVTEIRVGDRAKLTMELPTNPSLETVAWPTIPDTFHLLEVVERSKIDTVKNANGITLRQTLHITGFDSGAFSIPAFAATVKPKNATPYQLFTDSIVLHVSTLDVDTSKPFRAIKDIVPVATSWTDYLPEVALVLGALALLALLYYLYKKKKAKCGQIEKQPLEHYWDKSIRLLNDLEQEQLWQKGQVKEYYSRLTDILRQYLEPRFGIAAKEKTTEEINAMARKMPELRSYRKAIRDVLLIADMAKFAKAQPLPDEHTNALQQVRTFLTTTQPKPESIASNTPTVRR